MINREADIRMASQRGDVKRSRRSPLFRGCALILVPSVLAQQRLCADVAFSVNRLPTRHSIDDFVLGQSVASYHISSARQVDVRAACGLRRGIATVSGACIALSAIRMSRRQALQSGVAVALAAAESSSADAQTSLENGSLLTKLSSAGDVDKVEWPIWEAVDKGELSQLIGSVDPSRSAMGNAGADWEGLWRVIYAPHMQTMGSLAFTRFDVYYDIGTSSEGAPDVRSHVRFETPFGLKGWLNANGRIGDLGTQGSLEVPGLGPRPTSEVVFENFWVDLGAASPRSEPDKSDGILGVIARPLFIRSLSQFPTLFFDKELGLTVFRFPPLGVEITARRVGPRGASVRAFTA